MFDYLIYYLSTLDYVPDGFADFANALANPIKYQSELEKRSKQLSILTGETEDLLDVDMILRFFIFS
jgi:phosphatidylinositol phospholipase C beta